MIPSLIAEEGILKGLVLSLENNTEWIIGRDPDESNLLIEDPLASRKHLLCRQTSQGIVVVNLSETNPVLLNDVEIEDPVLLKSGDRLKIGGCTYVYTESEGVDDLLPPDQEDFTQLSMAENTKTNEFSEDQHQEENLEIHEDAHEASHEDIHEDSHEVPHDEIHDESHNEAQHQAEHETQHESTESDDILSEENRDTIFDEDDIKSSFAEINFGLVNVGRWLLKVISGPNNGAEFTMQSDSSHIVGTDPNIADIVFHDTSVSRQHLRLSISHDNVITIEDLQSRNGTLLDGEQIKEKKVLPLNTTVTVGTTTFVVYDRESEMKTIISPLLPSIFKVLQKEEQKLEEQQSNEGEESKEAEAALLAKKEALTAEKKEAETHHVGGFIVIGIITGLFVIAGIGIASLFKQESVEIVADSNATSDLAAALSPFPSIKPFYTASSGKLYLVGHILNAAEKNQLMYNLQALKFIKEIDDSGVVVDEYVWQEINQIINKNPNWKGINIYASTPGKFILTGYLQTRKQAEQLSDYITANFPYPDLLEKKIVVEEDVVSSASTLLQSVGFKDIVVQLTNGELTLTGVIPRGKQKDFEAVLNEIKKIPGVRNVRNFVNEVAPEATMINISDKYEVTGYSKTGSGNVNVVINGKILSKGDILDGMIIKEIRPNAVLLEKDSVQYRIDFNK